MERQRSFLPGQLASPAGQHQAIRLGELMLAIAPGHMLDHDTALAAVDPPHLVEEEDKEPPERNKLKAPFRQPVVTWCWLATGGAQCHRASAWPYRYLDALVVWAKAGVMVDETPEMVAAVEECDQFHG